MHPQRAQRRYISVYCCCYWYPVCGRNTKMHACGTDGLSGSLGKWKMWKNEQWTICQGQIYSPSPSPSPSLCCAQFWLHVSLFTLVQLVLLNSKDGDKKPVGSSRAGATPRKTPVQPKRSLVSVPLLELQYQTFDWYKWMIVSLHTSYSTKHLGDINEW